ncbi:LLM class flavin-dependent oxidoreductase [Mycolicibacterium sp. P9-22]|uniref:LLM class flavin-dependent oxidoreductase n=1 Tax=Mycolicibacterium sp. P9-22 TaxID=2024613 RepID=UPI001D1560DA|nr:TIGR03619 family F420-dependent LLM class oxidoreductase [Mycolicibacterium sp. P9-22]
MAYSHGCAPRPLIGLLLPSRDVAARALPAGTILDMATAAEDLGFDSVWLGESVVARPRHDPLVLLAAIAVRTRRITLGTAVLLAAQRHPLHVAHVVACLDDLSEGRVILGVGAGPSYGPTRKEYQALGVPFDNRVARLDEAVHLCRLLWREDAVTFDGTFFQVRRASIAPKPVQRDGPPIWLGTKGRRGRARAGALFDGWIPGPQSPTWYRDALAEVRSDAATAGRLAGAVTAAAYVSASIVGARETPDGAAVAALERYYGQPYAAIADLHDVCVGPAAAAADWLGAYVRAGVTHLVVRLVGDDPQCQMRALADYLPTIRSPGSEA